jgi:hypothetical protein
VITLAAEFLERAVAVFAGIGVIALVIFALAAWSSIRERAELKRSRTIAKLMGDGPPPAPIVCAGQDQKLQRRTTPPKAAMVTHPSVAREVSPYEAEGGDAGGPYGGSSLPPNASATGYFRRLVAHGYNPLEAALVARGIGDICFNDDYSPKKMLEVGMSWVMDRSLHREGPTWESRFWHGVKYRYVKLQNGDIIHEPVGPDEKRRPTDADRVWWVHEALRLMYPAWALEGVVPAAESEENGR